jgi:hypothetical protein
MKLSGVLTCLMQQKDFSGICQLMLVFFNRNPRINTVLAYYKVYDLDLEFSQAGTYLPEVARLIGVPGDKNKNRLFVRN